MSPELKPQCCKKKKKKGGRVRKKKKKKGCVMGKGKRGGLF
jgi:hypothetical protein